MMRPLLNSTYRLVFAACCMSMIGGGTSLAVTIAHWDFETDAIAGSAVDGQVVSHPSGTGAFDGAILDVSGNDNHLSAFTPDADNPAFADMFFSNNVAPINQTASTLSIEGLAEGTCCPGLFNDNTGNDGDLKLGGTDVGALNAWTIEASVNFKNANGWQTMVVKDGIGQQTGMLYGADGSVGGGDGAAAPLYFQKNGIDNRFRINFTAADGNAYFMDGQTVVEPDTWYHVAATSDGQTLSLYVNGALDNSFDMLAASGATSAEMIALDESGEEGDSGPAYSWALARGMYNDGHGDRLNGYLDDVRISNVALTPAEFLNVPEPAAVAIASLGLAGVLGLRRRRDR